MYTVYDGPSLIDGQPIVVLVNGVDTPSANRKTGWMAQTWILHKHTDPVEAHKNEDDRSVCGDCPHRIHSTCYVELGRAPLNAWRAYKRGSYTNRFPNLAGRALRIGSYGDPGAVPIWVWDKLAKGTSGHTGYTHQWRQRPDLQKYCMASVETEQEFQEAKAAGWRCYRVVTSLDDLADKEIACPYPETGLKCEQCMACNGSSGRHSHIASKIHGANWKQARFTKIAA